MRRWAGVLKVKTAVSVFLLIFLTGIPSLVFAQDETVFITRGETCLGTEGGYVSIGPVGEVTYEPDQPQLIIKEQPNLPNWYNRPCIRMDDYESGGAGETEHYSQIRIDTQPRDLAAAEHTVKLYFEFPVKITEPAWGKYLRVNDTQDVRLYGDVYLVGSPAGLVEPERRDVKLSVDVCGPAHPDGDTFGLLCAYDAYIRSARYGAGEWLSNCYPANQHGCKGVRDPTKLVKDNVHRRIKLNAQEIQEVPLNSNFYDDIKGYFIIQRSGIYLVNASWRCPNYLTCDNFNVASLIELSVYVSGRGEVMRARSYVKGPEGEEGSISVNDVFQLKKDEIVRLYVRHTAGEDKYTLEDTENKPRMSLFYLGGTDTNQPGY